jgi:hypothetical protein
MALVLNDRVKETTTTTGTGTLTLGGAVTGFETFAAGIGNSNTTYYAVILPGSAEFEVGLGTLSSDSSTIARTTIISSSNSDSAVNFSAGTKNIFCTIPASKSVFLDASGNVTIGADLSVGDDLTVNGGVIELKNTGSQSELRMYCESSNAHYAALQAPAHSDFAGNTTLTLPATTDTIVGRATTDTLTNKTLTTPIVNAGVQLKNGATSAGFLEFFEDSDNGTNKVTLIGPTSTADVTVTLPNSAGTLALTSDIAGTTVTNATNAAHVLVTDNESTDEDNLITFVEDATSSTGNVGLEMDGNLTYNPSTGRLTATQLAGTLQTAAQTNVTSLGTLTALTVDNIAINGTTIGHTSDTDLLTLASGVVTVAGEISVTTLDIGGTNVTATATELNHVDGVTSAIQTQLNAKAGKGFAVAMAIAL